MSKEKIVSVNFYRYLVPVSCYYNKCDVDAISGK